MCKFIKDLLKIDIYDEKGVKKILKKINTQLKENQEDSFELFGTDYGHDEFIKVISVLAMYLTDNFDVDYIENAYKASFDVDEYGALGEDRSEIEYYIDSFPTEEKLNLNTLLSKGYEYAEVLEDIFGEESFRYEF